MIDPTDFEELEQWLHDNKVKIGTKEVIHINEMRKIFKEFNYEIRKVKNKEEQLWKYIRSLEAGTIKPIDEIEELKK